MDFPLLTSFLDSHSTEMIPGMDVVIYKDHAPIYRHLFGFRDREAQKPMDGTELYWLFSATKVFTSAAAMQLIEKGVIKLDDPVSKYLPEFGTLSVKDEGRIRACTVPLTVWHLLTMTGGFNYDIECPSLKKAALYSGGKADTLTMIRALAEEPLDFEPGTHFRYSLCLDVLAAVIEVASGMRFGEYVKRNLFEPLGVKRSGFLGEDINEFAKLYTFDGSADRAVPRKEDTICHYRLTENFESGGAGMYSCVDDYILLADALACGGVGKSGNRILKPETVKLMSTDQLTPELRREYSNHTGPTYSYAMGVRTKVDPDPTSPVGEFGWDGAANAYTLIDPVNHVSAYLGIHILNFGYGYFTLHHKIREYMYADMRAQGIVK